jgi:phenylpyruvate tautomerase PptA (4-oxalocrotonate tautomerase family)
MNIGAMIVRLRIPENRSLKGKRKVVKSITSLVSNRFNVPIAEVDDHVLWQVGKKARSDPSREHLSLLTHLSRCPGQCFSGGTN